MTLCADCHDKEHIKNRSELTKEGIKKAKNAECDKLISVIDLLTKIQEEEPQSVIEIIDIIRSIPARKWERLAVRE